jgi:ribosomal-protein-alanine N-acetyltransferase
LKTDYIIRKMTIMDLPAVMEIEQEAFTTPWSLDSYMSEMKNQWASYQVCESKGRVTGYAGIWVVFEEARITNVAVSSAHRSRGIGRALMLAMEDVTRDKNGRRILLEVRPSNTVALKLYYSLGYYEIGRRKAYYADNQEDALILCKNLTDDVGGVYA